MATKSHDLGFGSWERVKLEGKFPSTRYSQAVTVLNDTLYLFGGGSSGEDDASTYYGDLFAVNLSVQPLEWKSIVQQGEVPTPRESANIIAGKDKFFLHGGTDEEGSKTCAEGLYVFTPADGKWERLATVGSPPTAQSSTAVHHEGTMITLGGIVSGVAQNCLHSLNLSEFWRSGFMSDTPILCCPMEHAFCPVGTLDWTEVTAKGTAPPPRCDHSAFVVRGKMVTTAGSGSEDLWFNDVHILDISSWTWSKVDPLATSPSPRDYTSVAVIADMYAVLFGGFNGTNGEECYADLYYVDCSRSSFEWKLVAVEPMLPARYAHSTFFYKGKFYIFGGQNMEEEFNDMWSITVQVPPVVSFDPTPVPRVRYSTSTPIPAPRKVITPAPPTTPKPRDLEDLRSSYTTKLNEMFDTLTERFQHLDMATATLNSEKAAFESEKKAHTELYEKQQSELEEMMNNHRQQNEEWIERMRSELNEERRVLAEEKVAAEAASAELAKQQETFQQKSKKLDAIMRQVQGLKD